MAETDNAYSLVSTARHPMELVYADYANDMKALGNRARMEIANTGKIAYSADAKKKYQTEVSSLDRKLKEALSNTPRERQALRLANAEVKAKRLENPDMKKDRYFLSCRTFRRKTSRKLASKRLRSTGLK